MGVVMKAKCLLLCLVAALPVAIASPAYADAPWSDWELLSCQGHGEPGSGPSWDLGPECNAVADPTFALMSATIDYAEAQANAVCTFVNEGPVTVEQCSMFAPEGG